MVAHSTQPFSSLSQEWGKLSTCLSNPRISTILKICKARVVAGAGTVALNLGKDNDEGCVFDVLVRHCLCRKFMKSLYSARLFSGEKNVIKFEIKTLIGQHAHMKVQAAYGQVLVRCKIVV